MEAKSNLVPPQQEGKEINASAQTTFSTDEEAKEFFKTARERLQRVRDWHIIAQNLSAEFELITGTGEIATRAPEQGDYLRVDIPGPGSLSGKGYDWVHVEDIVNTQDDTDERYGFRVRPAKNPLEKGNEVSHFYSPGSTSTFLVSRKGKTVFAEILDRNIKPNDSAGHAVDQVRATVIGTAGLVGFSKIQWQGLADGLIAGM